MPNNYSLKENNKFFLWISLGFLIAASCLMVILNVAGIVSWNQNNYQTTRNLVACSCGLILPLYIVGAVFYFFVDNKLNKKWLIIFILTCISLAVFFILLGAILLLVQNLNTKAAGMWILLLGTFGAVIVSFFGLIYYLFINNQQKQNFEKIIKDPKE